MLDYICIKISMKKHITYLEVFGRISMPVFAYLLVQGFFYTKNLTKYILRILILATLTQIFLIILGYINQVYFPTYWTGVNNYLSILYSYTLSLILLAIIDKKIIIKNLNESQNLIIRINIFILILITYLKLKIEFNMIIPFIILELYAIEKLFENNKILIKKCANIKLSKKVLYYLLILICFIISLFFIEYGPGYKYTMLLSIFFIVLYNGKKGKNNKLIKYIFYGLFPLQHIILYSLALLY